MAAENFNLMSRFFAQSRTGFFLALLFLILFSILSLSSAGNATVGVIHRR